jgi:hypothetical protein
MNTVKWYKSGKDRATYLFIDPFPLNLKEYNVIKLLKKALRTWLVTNKLRVTDHDLYGEFSFRLEIFDNKNEIKLMNIDFVQFYNMSIEITIWFGFDDARDVDTVMKRRRRRLREELYNIISMTLNQLIKDAYMAAYLPIRERTGLRLDPVEERMAALLGLKHKLPKPNFSKPNFMGGSRSRSRSRLSGGGYVQVKDLVIGQTYTFAFRDPRQRTNPPFEGIVLRKMIQNRRPGIRGVPDQTDFAFIKELNENVPYTNLYFGPSWITDNEFLIKDHTRISERLAAEALGRVFTAIPSSSIGNIAEFLGHADATGELVRAEVADKGRPGDIPSVLRPRN